MKRVIGITGGISSGKSFVCSYINKMGYIVLDCDKINKELSMINMPIYNKIVEEFGLDYLDSKNEIDKKKLGNLIFNNESAKIKLNNISHPLILKELKKQIDNANDEIIFVEIPLLFEAKLEYICDKIICVYLPKDIQIKRLMNRDNISLEYAINKINSQMPLEAKKELSDYIIYSDKSFDDTICQINDIIDKIKGE